MGLMDGEVVLGTDELAERRIRVTSVHPTN